MPTPIRVLHVAAALAATLLVAACGSDTTATDAQGYPNSPNAAEDSGPLQILEWEGYQKPDFHMGFESDHPNAKLDYQYAASSNEFLTKVKTGAKVDIAHPCSPGIRDWVDAGLVAPIDTTRLKNWDQLDPKQRELGNIDGKYYYVPWDWGYESLIVNTERVPDGKVPGSWADLWDPRYRGQFSMEDYPEAAVAMASDALKLPYPNLTDDQLEQVKQKLVELKPNVRTLWTTSAEIIQQMTNGDVSIGFGWNDQYANIKAVGTPVVYTEPAEGRRAWSCGYVIPKTTQHYDLALKFLDAAISQKSCVAAINQLSLGCSNATAVPAADQEIVNNLQLNKLSQDTRFAVALTTEQRSAFTRIWSEVNAGG